MIWNNAVYGFFSQAVNYALENEGGYVNDPDDSGGATNFGITIRTLSIYRGRSCSVHDVQRLTRNDAIEIYFEFFWKPASLSAISNVHIAMAIFDFCVLFGPHRIIKRVQNALELSAPVPANFKIDGFMGPVTIGLLNASSTSDFLRNFRYEILNMVESSIREKPSNIKYRNGWVGRADKLLSLGHHNISNLNLPGS